MTVLLMMLHHCLTIMSPFCGLRACALGNALCRPQGPLGLRTVTVTPVLACILSDVRLESLHMAMHSASMVRSAGGAGNSFASIGGFCAGSREIVDHQRLR